MLFNIKNNEYNDKKDNIIININTITDAEKFSVLLSLRHINNLLYKNINDIKNFLNTFI